MRDAALARLPLLREASGLMRACKTDLTERRESAKARKG